MKLMKSNKIPFSLFPTLVLSWSAPNGNRYLSEVGFVFLWFYKVWKPTNKRYVIYFTGLFEQGYVRSKWIGTASEQRIDNEKEALEFASKYRFNKSAYWRCKLYNAVSKQRFDFRVYSVKVTYI